MGGEADEFGGLAHRQPARLGQVHLDEFAHAARPRGEHQHLEETPDSAVTARRSLMNRTVRSRQSSASAADIARLSRSAAAMHPRRQRKKG